MSICVIMLAALVAAAAVRYGVDSRDGCDWKPANTCGRCPTPARQHTPAGDLAMPVRAVALVWSDRRGVTDDNAAVTRRGRDAKTYDADAVGHVSD